MLLSNKPIDIEQAVAIVNAQKVSSIFNVSELSMFGRKSLMNGK